ncbi:MAG: YgjV family protein [Lentisphaeria bacterium]|nr:YgjV family protein [Lentisphaeria bacterium]
MSIVTIIAQLLGIGGMTCAILSMQCRSNRNYFLLQGGSALLFCISFIMLNAWSGTFMNIFVIVRSLCLNNRKIATSKLTLSFLMFVLFLILMVLVYFQEKWYLLIIVFTAQILGTCAMWSQNGKLIRYAQIGVISPLWLVYNCVIPIPNLGGILTETLNIISVAIALFRYRKIGFTE